MNREELEKKAKELGLSFNDDTTDEDLQKMIEDEESRLKEEKDKNKRDPEWLEQELNKVIKQRDTAKNDIRKMKTKMENLVDKETLQTKEEELDNLKKQIEELTDFKKEVEEEKRKAEEAKMSDLEKKEAQIKKLEENQNKAIEQAKKEVKERFSKSLQELQEKAETQSKEIKDLRSNRLENDVIKAASKNKALNPDHIFRMIKNDFEYDSDLGKFARYSKDDKGNVKSVQDVDEYVKEFLSREENNYLVGAEGNLPPSSSTRKSDAYTKHIDSKYDPRDPKLMEEAEKENMKVEDLIEVKKKRDAKMAKIDEKRKSA